MANDSTPQGQADNTETAETKPVPSDEPNDGAVNPDTGLPPQFEGYEIGSFSDGTVSSNPDRKYIYESREYARERNRPPKLWWFDMSEVSWFRTNQILSNALTTSGGNAGSIDIAQYYREVAVEMTESWSGEGDDVPLTTFLTGLRSSLGQQLEEHLPDPGEMQVEEDEEENSDGPSEAAGEAAST